MIAKEPGDLTILRLFLFMSMNKPVMSPSVEKKVLEILAQFRHVTKWKEWGMDTLRKQGPSILLQGPPGTGKTTIARWMASEVGRGLAEFNVSKIGGSGGAPGSAEKFVCDFFAKNKATKKTIFMDECDHILSDRETLQGEAAKTWMLGTIEMIMMWMNTYPGLIICATNHVHIIDPALSDRFLGIVKVDRPDEEMRKALWKMKIPPSFPLRLSESQLKEISSFDLSGRQIEIAIINCASSAIQKRKDPTYEMLEYACGKVRDQRL